MYYEKRDFISQDLAENLIEYYLNHNKSTFQYRDNFPLNLMQSTNKLIVNLCGEMYSTAKKIAGDNLKIDNAEIVHWPKESFMKRHKDYKTDVLTSILYLNDNYIGGETMLYQPSNTLVIKPEIGKIVYFPNAIVPHEVKKITQGSRYTFAIWYNKITSNSNDVIYNWNNI